CHIQFQSAADSLREISSSRFKASKTSSSSADLLVEKLTPIGGDFIFQLTARAADLGKFLTPLVGTCRVDYGARAVADFVAWDTRVERTAPGASEDFDRLRRIGAAAERPQKFFGVGDVDVVIDHDHVAAEIRARAALARDQARLARVAGIALLDRDDREESPAR